MTIVIYNKINGNLTPKNIKTRLGWQKCLKQFNSYPTDERHRQPYGCLGTFRWDGKFQSSYQSSNPRRYESTRIPSIYSRLVHIIFSISASSSSETWIVSILKEIYILLISLLVPPTWSLYSHGWHRDTEVTIIYSTTNIDP